MLKALAKFFDLTLSEKEEIFKKEQSFRFIVSLNYIWR